MILPVGADQGCYEVSEGNEKMNDLTKTLNIGLNTL